MIVMLFQIHNVIRQNLVLGVGKSKIVMERKQICLGSEIISIQSTESLWYVPSACQSVILYSVDKKELLSRKKKRFHIGCLNMFYIHLPELMNYLIVLCSHNRDE